MNKHPDKIHHRAKARRLMAAWAALVLAGLCARGYSRVYNRRFIDRGYEDIVRDLKSLGADIGSET